MPNSPQLENGYTRISNEIIEKVAAADFNGTAYKIIMVIWRNTYGYNRKSHKISEGFMSKSTGISKRYISKELNKLIDNNVITVYKESTYTEAKELGFNKNIDEWRTKVPQVNNSSIPTTEGSNINKTDTVEQSFNSGTKVQHNSRTIVPPNTKKELNKELKKVYVDFSSEINSYTQNAKLIQAINDYIDHRKAIKKPITSVKQLKLILNKLDRALDKVSCLNDSVANGWQGIFPENYKKPTKEECEDGSSKNVDGVMHGGERVDFNKLLSGNRRNETM
jgi:phage replication O-like protein O